MAEPTSDEFAALRDWIGRSESRNDLVTAAPVAALAATLDQATASAEGQPLPPLWHWLYFLPTAPHSELGADGHPARGGFLPPVPLPRRMWAGSRITFHDPLTIGERIRRDSTISAVQHKRGRSGDLIFVIVRHEIHGGDRLAITEEQQIVYRAVGEIPAQGAAMRAAPPASDAVPRAADWQRVVRPDPVLLFRYSALTFNGHRIHYDRPYATGEEGYPGLVVHGPLLATLLLDGLRAARPDVHVSRFEFRAQRPLFDTADFVVAGARSEAGFALWAADTSGRVAVDARAIPA
jgi:3-methylfumaryl-CoA hydratase